MIRGRLRRPRGAGENEQADEFIEIDPSELSGLFAAPKWLRDAGFSAWFAVGVVVLVAGVVCRPGPRSGRGGDCGRGRLGGEVAARDESAARERFGTTPNCL